MRLREGYKRKVVSTDDAETIGRLEAFVGFDLGDAGSIASDRLLGLGSYAVFVQEVAFDEATPGEP